MHTDHRLTVRMSGADFLNLTAIRDALPNGRGGSLLDLASGIRTALQVAARVVEAGRLSEFLIATRPR
jgi:hypothetical protein